MKTIDVYTLPNHYKLLYKLLAQRSINVQISHQALPDFEDHCKFVDSNPYLHWYFIDIHEEIAGTAYITDTNTIGIWLLPSYTSHTKSVLQWLLVHHTPLPPIQSKRISAFSINISPNNTDLIAVTEEIGGKHMQNTYAFYPNTSK
jgi:hypothetical protein